MFSKRTWTIVSLLLVVVLVLSACGKAATDKPFTVGILTVGPITDNGWSTATYVGAQYVQSKIEGSQLIYAENVNTSANPNTTAAQFAEQLLESGANVITTEFSDWATNCPEYKVTAVQVTLSNRPSDWQKEWEEREEENKRIAVKPLVAAE